MGGYGSGRESGESNRKTTEDFLSVDVRNLKREGLIAQGQEELLVTDGVRLHLVWSPCGFGDGAVRPWFVCPGERCAQGEARRRAAILYLDGRRLLCRICLDLAYPSQRESRLDRTRRLAGRRARKARARLGPDSAPRPKGMHHSTFIRLGREYLEARREHVARWHEFSATLQEQSSQHVEQMNRERIELDL